MTYPIMLSVFDEQYNTIVSIPNYTGYQFHVGETFTIGTPTNRFEVVAVHKHYNEDFTQLQIMQIFTKRLIYPN